MSSQGNLSEDLHPTSSGSPEPLMRLTAENDGDHNVLDEFNYKPDIPTPDWTDNCFSSMPSKNVTVPLSSGMNDQQLQPSSLGTAQTLNNDHIPTQSSHAIQQQESIFRGPPNCQSSHNQQQHQQQYHRPYHLNSTSGTPNCLSSASYQHVPFSSSGMSGQQPLAPSSLVGQQEEHLASRLVNTSTRYIKSPFLNLLGSYRTCPQQCLPYMYPSSGTSPQCNISPIPRRQFPSSSSSGMEGLIDQPSSSCNPLFLKNQTPGRPFFNSSIPQRVTGGQNNGQSSTHHLAIDTSRRPQRQSNQCLERGESSSSVNRRQLQPSFLGTEENLNNYHIPSQNCHAQQQHQQGNNFHVRPNNQGLYNQMMMGSAPRQSEALTGVNQQLNARTTSLQEPNVPTMQQCQQQFCRPYDPNSTFGQYSGTQGLIDQRSSSFKSPCRNNQTHIRPFTNSSMPLQETGGHINGQSSTHLLATDTLRKRRSQSNQSEFGESSSSAKRTRIISPGENDASFADSLLNLREERPTNSVLSPTYRTSSLSVNPHLRRSDDIRSPYDERYEADRQYLDPHMRKFENYLSSWGKAERSVAGAYDKVRNNSRKERTRWCL
ncbi:hypothetical protein Bca52824_032262 [Brassica carinata]|uniref:Uncharacterized protein n=1 Tax=Brassica carinata TaxID=52824 RepID=A0A8X7SC48_BRACI|nr:hypothetical protein Bca52824_032262 [Brassica carinata]